MQRYPFLITFRPRPDREPLDWVRFYASLADATHDAPAVVRREYGSGAEVISIVQIPRLMEA